jgi:dihydrofolate reductase
MLSIVVAAAENGAIGKDNRLLWRLPDDLKYFKAVTMGKPIVMGRKTYESIGKPLPGRLNIVISRQSGLEISGCAVVGSLAAAQSAASDAPEIMIVGGADIYRQALPFTQRIYLTRVHARMDADVFFPELAAGEWRETHREPHAADERHAYAFTFITLERNT